MWAFPGMVIMLPSFAVIWQAKVSVYVAAAYSGIL